MIWGHWLQCMMRHHTLWRFARIKCQLLVIGQWAIYHFAIQLFAVFLCAKLYSKAKWSNVVISILHQLFVIRTQNVCCRCGLYYKNEQESISMRVSACFAVFRHEIPHKTIFVCMMHLQFSCDGNGKKCEHAFIMQLIPLSWWTDVHCVLCVCVCALLRRKSKLFSLRPLIRHSCLSQFIF